MVTDMNIGEELELELATFSMSNNLRQLGTKREIQVGRDSEVVSFFGEVAALNIEADNFLLNVGSGTIRCDGCEVQGSSIKVRVGDFIIHNPARVDLRGIYA